MYSEQTANVTPATLRINVGEVTTETPPPTSDPMGIARLIVLMMRPITLPSR
jgi:hypothetical protein